MLELLAGAAVAIALLLFVLEPLVRPAPPEVAEDEDLFQPLEESESPKVQALLALKDVEFDKATGKLSDEDYQDLKTRYEAQALAAIQDEENPLTAHRAPQPADPAEALIARARAGLGPACPRCGTQGEPGATFCSECGNALAA